MLGMNGKSQQPTTTTVVIAAITTSANNADDVFIATAGLTPRAAIIKLKISEMPTKGWSAGYRIGTYKLRVLRSDWRVLTLTSRPPRRGCSGNENGLAGFFLSQAVSMDGRGNVDLRDPEHANGDRFSGGSEVDH